MDILPILRSVIEYTEKKKEGGERTTSVRARAFLIAGGAGGSWSPSRENFLVKIQSWSPNPLLSLAQVRSIFPEKCTFSKKKYSPIV